MPDSDPLEDLERLPQQVQLAVLANELRNQARRVGGIERALRSVQVAMWGLVIALVTVSITIAATFHHP